MSLKLMVVGVALTVAAVKTDRVDVRGLFSRVVSKGAEQSLVNSQNALIQLDAQIRQSAGATKLARETRAKIDTAQVKLGEGRPFAALDYALQASSRAGELREEFERR